MLEIKIRFQAINKILNSEGSVTLLESLDSEFVYLQIRKIVEIIAFSAVLCDEKRYETFRTNEGESNKKDHGQYDRDWNARVILNKLNNISPHFMPIPISKRTETGLNTYHFDKDPDVIATHTKLIEIYKYCGGFMHIPNPFVKDYLKHVEKHREKYRSSAKQANNFVGYLKSLIWYHAAIGLEWHDGANPTENANPKSAWIVDFGSDVDQNVNIVEAIAA